MEFFTRKHDTLYCEDIPLPLLAESFGTPLFVYSRGSIEANLSHFQTAFEEIDPLICFSVKSNSNIAILNIMAEKNCGVDIVSGGELFRALKAGIDPQKIVYSGVGKTEEEIEYAIEAGILMFNVESEPELALISKIAKRLDKVVTVSLRVNPDIDAKSHRFTTTAKKEVKFGIPIDAALDVYLNAKDDPYIDPRGVDVHLGSPVLSIEPYRAAVKILEDFILKLRKLDIDIDTIDMGGGYGIVYNDETPFTLEEYAELVVPFIKRINCRLILEPGRSIIGSGGILLSKLTYVKNTDHKTFYILDAGMNDLLRPPLYGAYHRIEPVISPARKKHTVDFVGPICETTDFIALGRQIEECAEGDILAVMDAGAYSFSMSSNYNSRPRAAEVLVHGESHLLIRERETYQDLIEKEILP
jgi:diaminopimelate decarboxylase